MYNKPPLSVNKTVEKTLLTKSKKINKKFRHNVFNNANVVLRPDVDASERQILANNNFLTRENRVKLMLATEQYQDFQEERPREYGRHNQKQEFMVIKKIKKKLKNKSTKQLSRNDHSESNVL